MSEDRSVVTDVPGSTVADGELTTDGRQLRRRRNREAVVEALLDLYREGNLRPGTEEIAARSGLSPRSLFRYFDDVDDLIRTAMRSQEDRVLPLLLIGAAPDDPLETKVEALVEQRFTLYDAVGNAATVSRLRSPFHPVLAAELSRNRRYLRSQLGDLFAPEFAAKPGDSAADALAAADVLSSFESIQLLVQDQSLPVTRARSVMAGSLTAVLGAP